MYDVTIIGAGITGTYLARELSRYDIKVLVLDKDNDVANGTTKANTALVHAGYDAKPGTLMAKFNVEGNAMYEEICQDLYVPYERIGSLVLGFNEEDRKTIENLYENGEKNGVPELSILERDEILEMEPNIEDDVLVALYAKTAAITGPWELATALMENAMDNGVELRLNTEVENILKEDNKYIVKTNNGEIKSKLVVNCAGLYADKISQMVSEEDFSINPVKGQYFLLDKTAGDIVNHIVFQCPSPHSKGVIVTPTVHGNIIIGPDSVPVDSKEYKGTEADKLEDVRDRANKSIKDIPYQEMITTFAGLRANPSTGDFIIGEAKDAKGFINVAGIKSPGLTAAPAIGVHVKDLVIDILGDVEVNEDFNPRRRKPIEFVNLTDEEKTEVIAKDDRYGNVICRCETITEGEIVDAIHRNGGAKTVDAVKRRVRPGMGRCQGGFCLPKVIEILSRELDIPMEDVVKGHPDSYILTGKTK